MTALRERILTGDIEPGPALPEESIASSYGVARPTVRAALQELVFEGLLRRERNRSAYVPRMTRDDIRDLFFVRAPLELHAVATLAERGVVPAAAEEALHRMERLPPDAPWADVVDAALAFHRGLVQAVGSPRLSRLHRSLEAEVRLCFAQVRRMHGGLPSHRPREHAQILAAILQRDPLRATDLLRAHLEGAVHLLIP
ncbi:MAG: GntR family transcriptional regulator [Actinomycetota bacterium]